MNPLKLTKGDSVLLRYQLLENGAPRDVTGMSFKLAAKERVADDTPGLSLDGAIEDAASGRFSFTLTAAHTASPLSGRFEIAMFDASGKRTTLTPPGGVEIRVLENIID